MQRLATLWQQVLRPATVALKVPLTLHDVRMNSCQGSAKTWLLAGTDGAASAFQDPGMHFGLPQMVMVTLAFLTQPPYSAPRATGDVCRHCVIERGVPLCS